MLELISKIFSQKNMNRAFSQFGNMSIKWFFIITFIGLLIMAFVILIRIKVLNKSVEPINILAGACQIIYLAIMLQLTWFCRESGSRIGIKLQPFKDLMGQESDFHWLMIAYAILNVALFVPYGVAISLYSWILEEKVYMKIIWTILIGFLTSLIIEVVQLITETGYFEIEDIICNVFGGVIGVCLFIPFNEIIKKAALKKNKNSE
ncbi:Glycopeptide antibiotics resistance protein [Acetitomaculum ruminis DSM 5522]|uniref:Glycopeptide antibiotics resistance protein n=1 Tax=Acetitomaculum ruminis DSM 5522 TaxID=1120918 RepID=A0A1I0Z4A8_9FIRM|nr:VanZ family protein [Acetitomaculum ruminis]SFB19083.1 Glycopeptide antibiotics resistance protein [Acetitomaculum ruminis DSM 5522]